MPLGCSLQLDVYFPPSLTGEYDEDTIDWSASTDPDHAFPYLLAPRQYAEQEIDTIACTASIGQIEIGVMDVPTNPSDQQTGWMTARVHDVLGRRCRLRRYVNATIGWVVIADGPAGAPKMDTSYSAYRWTIRDTRETERKTLAFASGSAASIVPRGSIYGWGHYTDAEGSHVLLPSVLDTPLTGVFNKTDIGGIGQGLINLSSHFSGSPLVVDDPRLAVDEDAVNAMAMSQVGPNAFVARNADVLWREVGDSVWNIARSRGTVRYPQATFGYAEARLDPSDADPVTVLDYVVLFADDESVLADFPDDGADIEFIVRYRGPASEEFPYYIEGPLGTIIQNFYTGKYTIPDNTGITGSVYDPAGMDAGIATPQATIRYDPAAFAPLTEQVLLRQTETVEDGRAFTEASLYQPAGWIPALDNDGQISPVHRGRPETIDAGLTIENAHVVPSTGWNTGTKTVSSIEFTWNRYFIPAPDAGFETAADGIAIRPIDQEYEDSDSKLRYGDNPETVDASAFSAIGTDQGLPLPGQTEQANLLLQAARFDVLDRFRAGVQSISIAARRTQIPLVRVGDWIPWNLSWFPDRATGLRGSVVDAAQIISIRDDNCVWRTLALEESSSEGAVGGAPGFYSDGEVLTDELEPGFYSDGTEISDTEDLPS